MTDENGLERIFWEEGKFINLNLKEVNPKQIGESVIIVKKRTAGQDEIIGKVKDALSFSHREYASEINAYALGIGRNQDSFDINNKLEYVPLTFFKI